jgi:rare lipoprotein A
MKLSSNLLGMSALCAVLGSHALTCAASDAHASTNVPAGVIQPAIATQTAQAVQTSAAVQTTAQIKTQTAASAQTSVLASKPAASFGDIAPGSFADTANSATSSAVDAAAAAGGIDPGLRHRQLNADSSLLSMITTSPSSSDDDTVADDDDKAAPRAPFKAVDVSDFLQIGRASWYGGDFHGHRTADGSRFNMNAFTAAHRTLPLGSYLRVTNQANGKSVIVKINDRGPYARNRVLDLSYAAAKVIGVIHAGIARVKIQGLSPAEARAETTVASTDK